MSPKIGAALAAAALASGSTMFQPKEIRPSRTPLNPAVVGHSEHHAPPPQPRRRRRVARSRRRGGS